MKKYWPWLIFVVVVLLGIVLFLIFYLQKVKNNKQEVKEEVVPTQDEQAPPGPVFGSVSTLNHDPNVLDIRIRIISVNGNQVTGSLPTEGDGCTTDISSEAVLNEQGWLCLKPDFLGRERNLVGEVQGVWKRLDKEKWAWNEVDSSNSIPGEIVGLTVEREELERWTNDNSSVLKVLDVWTYSN